MSDPEIETAGDEVVHTNDAAYGPSSSGGPQRPLRNISEVRHYFRTNEVPIYFVGATPYNLLGLDRWVRNFTYVTYYDGWDGAHPRVFTPKRKPYIEFESGEEINNWLLTNPEVLAFIDSRRTRGVRPKIAMVFFDEETERICEELGYDLILPSAELREHLDSKLVTTRLGNDVGAPSVPNILVTVANYEDLVAAGDRGRTGHRPGRADRVRRLREDDLLHRRRVGLEEERQGHRRPRGQGDEADQQPPHRRGGGADPQRHHRRAVHDRADRALGADPVPGRLVRQRDVPQRARRRPAAPCRRPGPPARRPARSGGLSRVLRGRCAGRHRGQRVLPGGAEPADQRSLGDHQRDRGRVRRRAAVLLPPAGVLRRRLRARRGRDQRAVARAGVRRPVEHHGREGDRPRWSS